MIPAHPATPVLGASMTAMKASEVKPIWFLTEPTEKGWYFLARSPEHWQSAIPVQVRRVEEVHDQVSFEASLASSPAWLPMYAFAGAAWYGPITIDAPPEDLRPPEVAPPPPCTGCGGLHAFDTSVDSGQWNKVIREGGYPDYLCCACIVKAFAKAGQSFMAKLYGDGLEGESIVVRKL